MEIKRFSVYALDYQDSGRKKERNIDVFIQSSLKTAVFSNSILMEQIELLVAGK